MRPVSLIEIFLKNQLNDFRFVWVYNKVSYVLISLVRAALMLQSVAKRNHPTSEAAFFRQLFHAGFGTHRGLDAFPGCLPIANVVQQLVNMGIKPLLAFLDAPDFNTVFGEPFHNERCFVLSASQTIKHEHQQNIKLVLQSVSLDFLNGIPVFGRNLKPGNTLFRKLLDDFPSGMLLNKLPARFLLHGNVIFFDLSKR